MANSCELQYAEKTVAYWNPFAGKCILIGNSISIQIQISLKITLMLYSFKEQSYGALVALAFSYAVCLPIPQRVFLLVLEPNE